MTYTQSLEAWQKSYERGTRVFDADLNFTSDDVLVLRDEWSDDLGQNEFGNGIVPDYKTFISTPIFPNKTGGTLSPMDAKMMLRFLSTHNDVYAACDAKTDTYKTYSALVSCAKALGAEDTLKRIIVSFYWPEDKAKAMQAWKFKHFAFRYYNNNFNFNDVKNICKELDVPVCMVWRSFIRDDNEWKILLENEISVWAAVIDDKYDFISLSNKGISGCVSNYLFEEDLK